MTRDRDTCDNSKKNMEKKYIDPLNFSAYVPVTNHLNDSWIPQKDIHQKSVDLQSLTIVSYNIWFGTRRETLDEYQSRINALTDIILEQKPDIICLQEVTNNILILILENDFIRSDFWVSHQRIGGYQTVILSKLPCSGLYIVPFVTKLGRNLLVAEFKTLNNEKIAIGTVHLESYAEEVETRTKQLSQAYSTLYLSNEYKYSFLVGDFNFAKEEERLQQLSKMEPMKDTWACLHPNEDGFTFDTVNNKMTQLMAPKGLTIRNRIDIMLYKESDSCKPIDIQLLGTSSILNDPNLYPSDHFGVRSTFKLG